MAHFLLNRLRIAGLSLTCLALSIASGEERPLETNQAPHKISRSISYRGGGQGGTFPIEIGEVPVNSFVDLTIDIVNDSNSLLNLDEATISCSCIKAEIPKKLLEPGETKVCRILIDTSKRQQSHSLYIPIRLWGSDEKIDIVLEIKGHLTGFLGFEDKFNVGELSSGDLSTRIPVRFAATSPISGNLLHVEHSPNVGTLSISRVPDSLDMWELVVHCESEKIPVGGITTILKLEDIPTGRKTETNLLITREEPIRVSPRVLRLSQVSDENYKGSCIISIKEQSNPVSASTVTAIRKEASFPPLPIVSADFGGKQLSISLNRMNSEHVRAKLSISKEVVTELRLQDKFEDLQIKWSISSLGGAREFNSRVVLIDSEK